MRRRPRAAGAVESAEGPTATTRERTVSRFVRWVVLCAAAEAWGMTAAATAGRGAVALGPSAAGLGLALIVLVGLVEGTAVAWAQATALAPRVPTLRRGPWVALTVLVAGLGWGGFSVVGTVPAGTTPGSTRPDEMSTIGSAREQIRKKRCTDRRHP